MTPTQAMVLAAGLGVRMRPLTTKAAKPALPVMNRPLIGHVLAHLAGHGVTFAVVNAHHLPDSIEEAVGRATPDGMRVAFSRERTILGTAGGLRKAARHFKDERIFLVNADSLTDADLTAAARAHAASGRAATMIVREHDPGSGYRPIELGAGHGPTRRVAGIAGRRFHASHPRPATFTGIHVLEPAVLETIPSGTACDINADVYPHLLERDPEAVGAWLHGGWWFEAGSPARYLELNLEVLERSGRTAVVGPRFFIDEEARVERSVIGSGVRLARGAIVRESVIWDDVTVGEGVELHRCVVTGGVELPLMSLEETIVMQAPSGELRLEPLAGGAE